MEKIFNYLKQTSIAASVLRFGLGILFFLLGLLLAFLVDPIFFIIGILLAMIESVVIITLITRKSKRRNILLQDTLNTYLPGFEKIKNSTILSKAYKIFDYASYVLSKEVFYNIYKSLPLCDIYTSNFKLYIKGDHYNAFYMRLYVFKFNDKINVDLSKIKMSNFRNYRYEIVDDFLFITTISKGAYGKVLSLEPTNYKNYSEWCKRVEVENDFILKVIELNGGLKWKT